MISTILPSYTLHKNTFALLPAKAIDYDTIVLEKNNFLYIQQTPLQIIKNSCYKYGTTYEGRRKAVNYHTNFYQKIPLPISIKKRLYLFPTHSPKHLNNCWLSYMNISSAQYIKDASFKQPQTILQFKDGQTLKLNVSEHIMQTQMERTFQVMHQLETIKKSAYSNILNTYKEGVL